jgi:outer membrane protein
MKKIITTLSILAASTTLSYAETKIAVVNPVEIFSDSNLGSISVKKLENDLRPETAKLQQQRNEIIQKANELQHNLFIKSLYSLKLQHHLIYQPHLQNKLKLVLLQPYCSPFL